MPAPYRKASQNVGLFLTCSLGGVLIGIGTGSFIPKDSIGGWILVVVAGPIFVGLILGIWLAHRRDRSRCRVLTEQLSGQGWQVTLEPEKADLVFGEFLFLAQWRGILSSGELKWVAHREGEFMAEHEWVTGSGDTSQAHTQTIWAVFADIFGSLEGLTLIRPVIGERRAMRKAPGLSSSGVREFDRKWLAFGPGSAITTELRDALRDSPKGERWTLGKGWASCIVTAPLNGENTVIFSDRARRIVLSLLSLN